jgi:MSHA pilin protein MshA
MRTRSNVLSRRTRKGFTLIELVTVIVILGILAAVALPVYLDYRTDAKVSACKGVLGAVRAAIANYYAHSATDSGGGVLTFPALNELAAQIAEGVMPDNPYDTDATKNNIEVGVTKGTVVGTNGGWAYKASTGQFWANTSTAGENNY